MWTEIKLSQVDAADRQTLRLLKQFINAQGLMNERYQQIYSTKEQVAELLRKKASLGIFLAIYDDGETGATIALKKNKDGELRLLTTACWKGDIEKAADIVQAALKKAMLRLGVNSCYALWGANNLEAGNKYFAAFVDRCKANFAKSENAEYQPGKYLLTMATE